MSDQKIQPKLTIGIPVFNGEKVLKKCLDSIINQTYGDFEIILSDNASTDMTSKICKDYEKKDARIKFFQQKSNKRSVWNFYFVLHQSKSQYFMWAAADDVWHRDFIKKNIEFLEKNPKFVGSTSEIEFFDSTWTEKDFKKLEKISYDKTKQWVYPLIGNYEDNVKFLFQIRKFEYVYLIYRTESLKKSMSQKNFVSWEVPLILKLLKYGHINVEKGIMMYKSNIGKNNAYFQKLFSNTKRQGFHILHCLFPFFPLTYNVFFAVGPKIFFKDLFSIFIHDNYRAERLIFLELFSKLSK